MTGRILILCKALSFALLFLFNTIIPVKISAQYFGRNKVNYQQFNFKVLQSPHFEIYHYIGNDGVKNRIAQQAEQWYLIHQAIFRDTFKEKNPVILYNTHADFQQTNAVSGLIGVGTGGVTEGLKNRVIMPFLESNAQTDHVLGHELVHAFQYHLVRESDSLSMNSLNNLPLWMVEGLAEYMSIGYVDPHTAIWLRSAVLNNKLPTIKLLNNRPDEYFPYRWGQAFWAYVTGLWGDNIIRPLFVATAKYGYDEAFKRVLGMTEKIFSEKWKEAMRNSYAAYQQSSSTTAVGMLVAGKNNAGKFNIVPSISPDGKLMAFWSEKEIFNLDLFLADAATGRIVKKLTSTSFSSHIDEFSSYESSVGWSPDSRQLAFVAFAKGKNRLIIESTEGRILHQLDIPGVDGFSNPAWSPDGKTIVVTGLVNGQPDLYAFNIEAKTVKQLTNDKYAELHPSWSVDGKWVVFSTDRNSFKTIQHQFSHDLALMNMATGEVQTLSVFEGANNFNPVFAPDNSTLYFLSDRDGLRNLYSYNLQSKELFQLTNLYTGITGITLYAPAISASRKTDQLLYSYYDKDEYSIYSTNSSRLVKKPVDNSITNPDAAMLPPAKRTGKDLVQANINSTSLPVTSETSFVNEPYRSKFQLDYIGNTGMGVSTSGGFGSGASGGVEGLFSDMLGNHQLYGSLALNGEIYDFGGQFAYINAKKRFNWGASISHLPYLSGIQRLFPDTLVLNGDTTEVANLSTDILRTYEDQVALFAAYPFSQTRRLEAGGSFARYHYRLDRYTDYYTTDLQVFIGSERNKLPVPKGFNFGQAYLAYVGDNSQFGVASPLIGHRYRFEAGQYFGIVNMQSLLGDYRKYFRLRPFTFATRNMYMGRFGEDAESGVLPPLYIGYPFYIRGYEAMNFAEQSTGEELTINDLIGSKIFITNAELRFPFTGPERLSAIRSRFLFTELNLFTDGGIAWGNPATPSTSDVKQNILPRDAKFILSSGLSIRINLFGYLVIEPYYAIPWQNGGFKNGNFGLNFLPGW